MEALGQCGTPAVIETGSIDIDGRFLSKARFPCLKKSLVALFQQTLNFNEKLFRLFDLFTQNYSNIEIEEICAFLELLIDIYHRHSHAVLTLGILGLLHSLALSLEPQDFKLLLDHISPLLKNNETEEQKTAWKEAILEVLIEKESFCVDYKKFAEVKNSFIDFSIEAGLWGNYSKENLVIACAEALLNRLQNRRFICNEVRCLLSYLDEVQIKDISLICGTLFNHRLSLFSTYYWIESLFETCEGVELEFLVNCFFKRALRGDIFYSDVLILIKILILLPQDAIQFQKHIETVTLLLLNGSLLKNENTKTFTFLSKREIEDCSDYASFNELLEQRFHIFELILEENPKDIETLNEKFLLLGLTYLHYFVDLLSLEEIEQAFYNIYEKLNTYGDIKFEVTPILEHLFDICQHKQTNKEELKQFCSSMSVLFSIGKDWLSSIAEFCRMRSNNLEAVCLYMEFLPYLMDFTSDSDKRRIRKDLVLFLKNEISDPLALITFLHRACSPEALVEPDLRKIFKYGKILIEDGISVPNAILLLEMLMDLAEKICLWELRDARLFFTLFLYPPITKIVIEQGWSSRILPILKKPFILSGLKKLFMSFKTENFTEFCHTQPLTVAEQFVFTFTALIKEVLQKYGLEADQRIVTLNLVKACVRALNGLSKRYQRVHSNLSILEEFYANQLKLKNYRSYQLHLFQILEICYRRIKNTSQKSCLVRAQVEICKVRKISLGYKEEPTLTIKNDEILVRQLSQNKKL